MKAKPLFLYASLFLAVSCTNIKNEDADVQEENGVKPEDTISTAKVEPPEEKSEDHILLGNWVGYFENASDDKWDKAVFPDEGLMWLRENKINISIDRIWEDSIFGHSVVAGNQRPFKGVIVVGNTGITGKLYEPGDNKYDGTFGFSFMDSILNGTWKSYKKIEISHRKYALKKKVFKYNPKQMLDRSKPYADWNKEIREPWDDESEEVMGEYTSTFASATEKIYEINASSTLLTKKVVSNLKKGDLKIIRNTIYARHGYSFKNRPLRVFFDAQPWYIPVYADIKKEFTEVEKKNIQLLLKYEKNAEEYYDYFGRG